MINMRSSLNTKPVWLSDVGIDITLTTLRLLCLYENGIHGTIIFIFKFTGMRCENLRFISQRYQVSKAMHGSMNHMCCSRNWLLGSRFTVRAHISHKLRHGYIN